MPTRTALHSAGRKDEDDEIENETENEEKETQREQSPVPLSVRNAARAYARHPPTVITSNIADQWHRDLVDTCYRAACKVLHDILLNHCGMPLDVVEFLADGWMDTVALYYRFEYNGPYDHIYEVWDSPVIDALGVKDPVRVCLVSTECPCRDCRLRQHWIDWSFFRIRYDVRAALSGGRQCPVCDDLVDGNAAADDHIKDIRNECRRTHFEDTVIIPSFPMAFPAAVVGAILSCFDHIVNNTLVSSQCDCCPPVPGADR